MPLPALRSIQKPTHLFSQILKVLSRSECVPVCEHGLRNGLSLHPFGFTLEALLVSITGVFVFISV